MWHGSASNITFNGRKAGALNGACVPASLLRLTAVADLHWVRVGFVADATADIDSHGLTLRDVQGGGPIEDLRDFGFAEGWRGNASFKFRVLKVAAPAPPPAMARSCRSPQWVILTCRTFPLSAVADGADLGAYTLHLANAVITPGADATAELNDTGGPLEVQATLHLSADGRTGMLSGTVKARPDASPALSAQVDKLTQLHARDAQGRIPVEVEFTL